MVAMTAISIAAEFENDIWPGFPEALVRGGLGHGLKRMMCINKTDKDCSGCFIHGKCLYGIMYSETGKTRNRLRVSPYGIHCTITAPREMSIELTLFAPLLDYYGHLVAVLSEIGKTGIGRGRNNFVISGVFDMFAPERIYDYGTMTEFKPSVRNWKPGLAPSGGEGTCVIDFISPARIARDGRMQHELTFQEIVKSCVMRYLNLERAFSGGSSDFSSQAKDAIDKAAPVVTGECNFTWQQKERYSASRKAKISAGGFTGRAVYRGDARMFADLLEFGSHSGIGKNTTFGCGRFRYAME